MGFTPGHSQTRYLAPQDAVYNIYGCPIKGYFRAKNILLCFMIQFSIWFLAMPINLQNSVEMLSHRLVL